ncbi:MAG: DHHW family protein [Eubacteriales bacterium]
MKIDKILAAICIIIMCFIGFGTLFADNKAEKFSESENRMLEGLPAFTWDNIIEGEFASSFEKYMIDRIPFRDYIIGLQSIIAQSMSIVTLEDTFNVIDTNAVQQMENMDEEEFEDIENTPIITPAPTPVRTFNNTIDVTATINELPDTPEPTATPDPNKFSGSKYRSIYYYEINNEKKYTLAKYSTQDVINYAGILTQLSDLLPADGHTVFIHSLESAKMRPVSGSVSKGKEISITDETVEVLEYYTKDNVKIFSAPLSLQEPIKRQEYVYYLSDIHWTVEGLHYIYLDAMNSIGVTPLQWDEYDVTYEYPFLGTYYRANKEKLYSDNPDTLALIDFPEADTFLHYLGDHADELPILDFNAKSNDRFTVHFGGPKKLGPLSVVKTTSSTGKNALVIIDSFGLPFANMMIPHYDNVCIMDLRYMYLSSEKYYIEDIVNEYNVDDIFVVASDLNSFGTYYYKAMKAYIKD